MMKRAFLRVLLLALLRAFLFLVGLLLGLVFDMVVGVVERLAGTDVCRESCPPWLTSASLAVYVAMPLGWGVLLAIAGSKPRAGRVLLAWACASLLLMLALTWLLYLAQHPVR